MKPVQITIFEELIMKSADELLDMLNEGRTKKELFYGQYTYRHGNFNVFMAANIEKKAVFNVLDDEGNIPAGFSMCWRDFSHIENELNKQNK